MPIFDTELDTPAQPSAEFSDMWRDNVLVDDLDGGVRRMRWRKEMWLPIEQRETPEQYCARINRSHLFPGESSALDGAVSRPFSKPVTVEEEPDNWEPWIANVDGAGSDLTQFARCVMRSAVKHGKTHILTDFTAAAPGQAATLANEKGKRPISVHVEATQLLSWKTLVLSTGELGLAEVTIHDIRTLEDGTRAEFVKIIRPTDFVEFQNKAYHPPKFRLASQNDKDSLSSEFYDWRENRQQDWDQTEAGPFGPQTGKPFESVPMVTIYTKRTGYMTARPALMDLAETNVIHWQSSSDQRNILHIARVPILFATGFESAEDKGGITIGAGAGVSTQNADARLQYVEHSGAAVGLGADDLESLEMTMEILGVRPLIERSGDMTATGAAINANAANTDVQAWLLSVQTGLKQMFTLWGQWLGLSEEETAKIEVAIFSDFAIKVGDATEIATLVKLEADKAITKETMLREINRRGMFADGFDVEEELKELSALKDEAMKALPEAFKPGGKPEEEEEEEVEEEKEPVEPELEPAVN